MKQKNGTMTTAQSDDCEAKTGPMHNRKITLSDGRYMIFYTFDDERETSSGQSISDAPKIAASNDV